VIPAEAVALAIACAATSAAVIWAVTFYLHLTADDRRYRKNLRKGKHL
jgi:hypothetical protein